MDAVFSFSGLSAKISAMQGKLLTDEDYRAISELKNLSEFASYLSRLPGYPDHLIEKDFSKIHREDLEEIFQNVILYDFHKIYHFCDSKKKIFMDMIFMNYEANYLKRVIRYLLDHRPDRHYSEKNPLFWTYSNLDQEAIEKANHMEDLLVALKNTRYYHSLYVTSQMANPRPFDYTMALDLSYYSSIWKMKKRFFSGKEEAIISELYGRLIDLSNISWIYRAKKYYSMKTPHIYPLLIPINYRLNVEDIKALAQVEDMSHYHEALQATQYKRFFTNQKRNLSFDDAKDAILKEIYQTRRREHPYSYAIIYTYLYLKEQEILNLITGCECIRYGYPPYEVYRKMTRTGGDKA